MLGITQEEIHKEPQMGVERMLLLEETSFYVPGQRE